MFFQSNSDEDLAKPASSATLSMSEETAVEKETEEPEKSEGDALKQMLDAASERGSDGLKGVDDRFKAALAEAEALVDEIKDETQSHWEPLADTDGIKVLSHASLKNCTLAILTVQAGEFNSRRCNMFFVVVDVTA